jgi:hypothetical protein
MKQASWQSKRTIVLCTARFHAHNASLARNLDARLHSNAGTRMSTHTLHGAQRTRCQLRRLAFFAGAPAFFAGTATSLASGAAAAAEAAGSDVILSVRGFCTLREPRRLGSVSAMQEISRWRRATRTRATLTFVLPIPLHLLVGAIEHDIETLLSISASASLLLLQAPLDVLLLLQKAEVLLGVDLVAAAPSHFRLDAFRIPKHAFQIRS